MEPLGVCLVVAAGAVVIAVAIAAAMHAAKVAAARTAALRAIADHHGLRFTAEDRGLDRRLGAFDMFTRGHSRRGRNLMEGEFRSGGLRTAVLMGDYRYKITKSNGKSTTTVTYNFSFVAMRPVLSIPDTLDVRPEGFLDKLGAFVGFDDIDFESSEFSKRFHVKCSDRRFAFDIFDPRMMEFFLGCDPMRISARGGWMLFERGVRLWEIDGYHANLAWIEAFLSRIPRHVRAARLPASEHALDPVLNPDALVQPVGESVSPPPPPPPLPPDGRR